MWLRLGPNLEPPTRSPPATPAVPGPPSESAGPGRRWLSSGRDLALQDIIYDIITLGYLLWYMKWYLLWYLISLVFKCLWYHISMILVSLLGLAVAYPSANRVTNTRDYFYFNRLYAFIRDYLRFRFICDNSITKDYTVTRLFHYLPKDDYFTYCTTIISLNFSAYIIAIIAIIHDYVHHSYYTYYCVWDEWLPLFFPIMCIMHIVGPPSRPKAKV